MVIEKSLDKMLCKIQLKMISYAPKPKHFIFYMGDSPVLKEQRPFGIPHLAGLHILPAHLLDLHMLQLAEVLHQNLVAHHTLEIKKKKSS